VTLETIASGAREDISSWRGKVVGREVWGKCRVSFPEFFLIIFLFKNGVFWSIQKDICEHSLTFTRRNTLGFIGSEA